VRLVLAGTPSAAVPALEAVLDSNRHELLAVVTRPDARSGRGRELSPSPVKQRALEAGVEVLAPARPSDPDFLDRLRALAPDCCPVVAYGALVPPAALEIPVHGWVNLHFSILPAWRGAAPVQHAILAGDDLTGATAFRLEAALDTGPVYGVMTTAVGPRDTAGDLLERLSQDGAKLLIATLDGIEDGALEPQPQSDDGISLAPKLTTADARVDWATSAIVVDRRIRACTPAPGGWTTFRDRRLGLGPVVPLPDDLGLAAGQVRNLGRDGVVVGTGTGPVRLGDVRPEGRSAMAADAWARGIRPVPDDVMT
jgi:methionyl-tRNA formyltransferase